MEVLAQVLAVEPNLSQNSKLRCTVKLLLDKPFQGVELKLFEHHQKGGAIDRFHSLAGKKCVLPLEVSKYRDELQYGLAFGELPELFESVDKSTGEVVDDIPFSKTKKAS